MDTFFARNRLSAYLDGVLSDAEAQGVSDHRGRPGPRRVRGLQQATNCFGVGAGRSPHHARVMESVRDEAAPGGGVVRLRRFFTRVPVEALALAAAALVVISVVGGRPTGEDPVGTDAPIQVASDLALPSSASSPPSDERLATVPESNKEPDPKAVPTPEAKPVETRQASARPDRKKSALPVPKEPMQTEWEQQPQAGEYAEKDGQPFAYRLIVREQRPVRPEQPPKQYAGKVADNRGRT